jgi:sarcosine/dimethylglycine N-methyltransferase
MAHELGAIDKDTRIADFGAGYGGSARWLARTYGCHISCINLSEVQNERNRQITDAAGLTDLIDVYDASFEDAPVAAGSFDHVWSQDSLLHAGDRARVLDEVDRILKPGGSFIFTDPMQADDCPPRVLQPVLGSKYDGCTPEKSTKHFSPALCSCLIVTLVLATHFR